jgi:hypothetical protein
MDLDFTSLLFKSTNHVKLWLSIHQMYTCTDVVNRNITDIGLPVSDLVPFVCQRDMCPNAGNAEAAKVCYDHCISITFASDSPPPLYLCIECANEIHREHPNQMFFDILHPMQQVSMTCENKVSLLFCLPWFCSSDIYSRCIGYAQDRN